MNKVTTSEKITTNDEKSQPVKKARHFFETLFWNADVFMVNCSQYSQYKNNPLLANRFHEINMYEKNTSEKKHRDEICCKNRNENIAQLEGNKVI